MTDLILLSKPRGSCVECYLAVPQYMPHGEILSKWVRMRPGFAQAWCDAEMGSNKATLEAWGGNRTAVEDRS